MDNNIIERYDLNNRIQELKKIFDAYRSHFREIADNMFVRYSEFLVDKNSYRFEGATKKNGKVIDYVVSHAINGYVAGMASNFISPTREWFKLQASDYTIDNLSSVRKYLDFSEKTVYNIMANSNFYENINQVIKENKVFGQGCMIILEDEDNIIHTRSFTQGEYFIDTNYKNEIDTLARTYCMTIRQVVDNFGIKNVSKTVKDKYEAKQFNELVDINHIIYPNKDYDPTKLTVEYKKYSSVYWESNENKPLQVSGFEEIPFACPRHSSANSTDVYASSCTGMEILQIVKRLYTNIKTLAKIYDKTSSPPLVADYSLKQYDINTNPDAITFADLTTGDKIRPLYNVNVNTAGLENDNIKIREDINKAFNLDLFLMLTSSDRRNFTATEIEYREQEKNLIAPLANKLGSELCNVVINRIFNIAYRKGLLPEPPEELQGKGVKIEYVSSLHQTQKASGLANLDRFLNVANGIIQVNPSSVYKLDSDEIIDEYARILGVSHKVIRDEEKIQQLIAQDQERQQLQEGLQGADVVSQIGKNLSQSKVDKNSNLLENVINNLS